MVGTRICEPIVIPEEFAEVAVKLFHKGNCGTQTRLINIAKCEIWCARLNTLIIEEARNCATCTYQRTKNTKIVSPDKSYDDCNPELIGQVLFADTITRNAHSSYDESTYKFWVISCALSGYTRLYHVRTEKNNSASGSDVLLQALSDFDRGIRSQYRIKIFMDGWSVNKAIKSRQFWDKLNVEFVLPAPKSNSKNALAPLDSRIQKISPILQQEIWNGVEPKIIALRVSDRVNQTKGAHGYSGYEIWHNRTQFSNEGLNVDLKSVRKFVENARKRTRQAQLRNELEGRVRLPYIFRPYKQGDKYGNELETPIKEGDYILIEGRYCKNQVHPWFKICKTEEIPTAIDWDHSQVGTIRMGLKNKKYYTWAMRSIKAIINGDSVNSSDMSEYIKAMRIFKERNPEMILAEQLKPRNIVANIDLCIYGEDIPNFEETVVVCESEDSDGICETCSDSSDDEYVHSD